MEIGNRHELLVVAIAAFALFLTGCSLITIKSEVEPIPPRDLKARLMTRDALSLFADRIKVASNQIESEDESVEMRTKTLRWQIGAIEAARRAAMRQDPREALVDLWGLCLQQRDFLSSGAGQGIFGANQSFAVQAAEDLLGDVSRIADETLAPELRARMKDVVDDYAKRFPIEGLDFNRAPVVLLWREAAGGESRIDTVGTTPEVVQDVSDRMRMLGQALPESVSWRTELLVTERQEEIRDFAALLERLDEGLASVSELAAKSPELAANAARELHRELSPALEDLDARWGESLSMLETQRMAIVADLERLQASLAADFAVERDALTQAVDEQRAAIMQDARNIATDVTERALARVQQIVREGLVLLIILVVVLLGLPFGAGFLLGRSRGRAESA